MSTAVETSLNISGNVVEQIKPMRVESIDQVDLLFARPFFSCVSRVIAVLTFE